jgi:hypothetical protein
MRCAGHEHYIRIEPTVGQLVMNISFARTKEISYIMNSKAYDICGSASTIEATAGGICPIQNLA